MSWTLEDIPDLSGTVTVVAGPHCARGRATVRHLARHGAHVVLVGGEAEALGRMRLELLEELPGASLGVVGVDEASLAHCIAAAEQVLAVHPRIDLLVNNRCPTVSASACEDGDPAAATQPAVGLFAFTAALMPGLSESRSARVVTVTARSDEDDADMVLPVDGDPTTLVPLSVLDFARELHDRLAASRSTIQSLAADPGRDSAIMPALAATPGPLGRRFGRRLADRDAMAQLQAATDPEAEAGQLYTPMFNTSGPIMWLPMHPPGLHADRKWVAAGDHAGIAFRDPCLARAVG